MITDKYLCLLEKALSFSLWPEPPRPLSLTARRDLVARAASLIDKTLSRFSLRLCLEKQIDRDVGAEWPLLAHTMVGRKRLRNIRELCATIEFEQIPGNFVECGVWRGGASMFARACLPLGRKVILCDSFDGLPFDPDEPDFCEFDSLKVPLEKVQKNFRDFDLFHNVEFVKGWFKDTLPGLKTPIAILRADGDMYSSTMQILGNLYDQVVAGGFVIIDDYGLEPCHKAVDDFRRIKRISDPLIPIDEYSVYWRKP